MSTDPAVRQMHVAMQPDGEVEVSVLTVAGTYSRTKYRPGTDQLSRFVAEVARRIR